MHLHGEALENKHRGNIGRVARGSNGQGEGRWRKTEHMNVGAIEEEGSLSCGQHHRVSVTDSS